MVLTPFHPRVVYSKVTQLAHIFDTIHAHRSPVEYAIEAIKVRPFLCLACRADLDIQLGSTTVGIRTPDGVVLGVEKRVQSPLLEASSIEKIMEIDRHLGCAVSGLTADARTMVDHARVTAQNHAFTYDERIKVESVTQAVCDLALRFGESVHDEDAMMSRPFGVALLIAGIDELGPQLYVSRNISMHHHLIP